jgi:hypothetical protein
MTPELKDKMRNISLNDRHDPVANVCRRLYLRVELCPCMQEPTCRQCEIDMNSIEKAWNETNS